MSKKFVVLAAVLAVSLAVAVPALAQESILDRPLENQNDTCTPEFLERVPDEYTPDMRARDCGLEEGDTPGATPQRAAEDTEQAEAVDDKFSASGGKDATIDAPSRVSEGAERTDAQRDEPSALKVSPAEQTGASPQAGAQPEAGAESADSTQDSSSEGTTPEKQVANTDKEDTASELLGPSEEEVASGGRIASKGTLPEGNAAHKAATRGGAARTDSGARKVIRNEARKSTKPKAISKQNRKAAHKSTRVSAAGSSKKDQKALRKAARANIAGSKRDRKAKAARANTSANKEDRTPDKDTAVSEEETTDSKDIGTDTEATLGDIAGEDDNTTVATPTKSNVPLFLGGGLVFVMSAFLVSKAVLWWFRSPLSRERRLLRP